MTSRLTKEARHEQLLDVAAKIIREKGTEALTLITLAQQAGVTKPITYKHFASRQSLLHALYKRCDKRFVDAMNIKIQQQATNFEQAVTLFTDAYLDCLEQNGREYNEVIFALMAYPEYRDIHREIRHFFCQALISVFRPFISPSIALDKVRLAAIYGALEAVADILAEGPSTPQQARLTIERLLKNELTA